MPHLSGSVQLGLPELDLVAIGIDEPAEAALLAGLGFTDDRAAQSDRATLRKAYEQVRPKGAENIEKNFSGYSLADELSGIYRGMMISIPERHWVAFERLSRAELIELLRALAHNVNLSRFQKHRRGPKKPAKKRKSDKNTPHVSTANIIASRKK